MAGHVKLTGFKEAQRALLDLSTKEARKIGRAAVRKQARAIAKAAKEAVPVDEGRLKRAVSVRVDMIRDEMGLRGHLISALVYISDKQGPRRRKTDRQSTVRGRLGPPKYGYQIGSYPSVYGGFVEFGIHGPAQPFFRPAWDRQGGNVAITAIGKDLSVGIEAAAGALGAGRPVPAIADFGDGDSD